jgi:hypothetical protein
MSDDYYQRREDRTAMVAVYVVAGWVGLMGGMVGYWIMRAIGG